MQLCGNCSKAPNSIVQISRKSLGHKKAARPVYAAANGVEGKIAITKRLNIVIYTNQALVVMAIKEC